MAGRRCHKRLAGRCEIIQIDAFDGRGIVGAQNHELAACRIIHRPGNVAQICTDQLRGFIQEDAADGRLNKTHKKVKRLRNGSCT